MTARELTDPVAGLVEQARAELAGKPFSDILDTEGNQYVDLVLGGGGVLGIALVGYTYVLEELGLRFLRVGGTAAGAVTALGLAALGPPARRKSTRLLAELADLDGWSFVDGRPAAKSLVRDFLEGRSSPRPAAAPGLHPGHRVRDWLAGVVGRAGITTDRQLRDRLRERPAGLRLRHGGPLTADDADARLGVVATDLTTETRAVFPLMAPLYWADPDHVNPADFVRAAVSIPFFFEPVRVTNVPQGEAARRRWRELTGREPFPPAECAFVAGGMLSPFPIDLFHEPDRVPTAPTFGVRLTPGDQPVPHADRLVEFTTGVLHATRHALDHEFLTRHPDFRELVCAVDTSTHNWLGFDLTADDKAEQFRRGAEAAVRFLTGFDWPRYQELRRGMIGPPGPG